MAHAFIEFIGERIRCANTSDRTEWLTAYATAAPRLRSWASRYDEVSRGDNEDELAAIGREIFAWLDDAGWATAWAEGAGDRDFEIRVGGGNDAREAVLIDAPWELLADDSGPLALDALRPFTVARRVGVATVPWEPTHSDFRLLFMAAAPKGQVELDFEREEAAILEATRDSQRVQVAVEETGTLRFLGERLHSEEGPFEAAHLSCHGAIMKKKGPVLLLETAEGGVEPAGAGDLIGALGVARPPLVVLSACRTAEIGRPKVSGGEWREAIKPQNKGPAQQSMAPQPEDAAEEFAAGFARQVVIQVPNVVGWDGSVYDRDATEFAQVFYGELGRGSPVPRAAAQARRSLLQRRTENPKRGRHWHMARVYLGPAGGGQLCAAGKPKRTNSTSFLEKAFLDKEKELVPVASRREFVGRRREIQSVLRAFGNGIGVLVHGMGELGKSSLAARVASRMPRHRPVVIFKHYDALAIFGEVLKALPPRERWEETRAWRELVEKDPADLALALESWLAGPLNAAPILLIMDDLEERVLDTPAPVDSDAPVSVAARYRTALGAVLKAFAQVQTTSRLLLTSRYIFRLPDGADGDLAADLVRIPLKPMPSGERIKQRRATELILGYEDNTQDDETRVLLDSALDAAAGNPGLQAILTRLILAGELGEAKEGLSQIAIYRQTGAPPEEIELQIAAGAGKDSENPLVVFFARLSFATYRAALSPDQARQLTAATLFSNEVPIPCAALEAAGAALGVEAAEAAVERLLALGLLDNWDVIGGAPHAAINPLARPLAMRLDPADRPRLARAALPVLLSRWSGKQAPRTDRQDYELTQLGLLAGNAQTLVASATGALQYLHNKFEYRKAADLGQEVIDHLSAAGLTQAVPSLLRFKGRALMDAAEYSVAEAALQQALLIDEKSYGSDNPNMIASLQQLTSLYETLGKYDMAAHWAKQALEIHDRFDGPEDRGFAKSLYNLALLSEARGQYKDGLSYAYRALEIQEKILESNDEDIVATLNMAAKLHAGAAEYQEALSQFERALKICSNSTGSRHRYKATICNNLGLLWCDLGEYDKAKLYLENAMELWKHIYGEGGQHPEIADTVNNIGIILRQKGELDDAEQFFRRALKSWETALTPNHHSIGTAWNNIGLLHLDRKEYGTAKCSFLKAIEIWQETTDLKKEEIAIALNNLAEVSYLMNLTNDAIHYGERALAMLEHALGPYHPLLCMPLASLERYFTASKQSDKSQICASRRMAIEKRLQEAS